MNISAMRYYNTRVYNDYLKNIEILKDTVLVRPGCIGTDISIRIIDNNRKHFKKRRLSGEFVDPNDTNCLHRCLNELVNDYIKHRVGYAIQQEINNKLVEDWRCQNDK